MMKRVIVGSLALSFGAGLAMAQQPSTPVAGTPSQGAATSLEFSSIDANRDGRISTAEVQSNSELKSSFASLDADRDSYLSQSEYSKWNKAGKMSPSTEMPKHDTPVTEPAK